MAKAGRRSMGERVNTQVRLPVEMHVRLREAADERDLTVNYMITKAVARFLDDLKPVDEWKLTR